MKLNQLPKTTTRPKKRRGRGYGSGKGGHLVGRGKYGQKSREKVREWFEGGQTPILKRMAMMRGKGKFSSFKAKPVIINLQYLDFLPKNTKVTLQTLSKYHLVDLEEGKKFGVKILGGGELKKPLTVQLPCSHGAAKKIKKAGGKIETSDKK